MTEAGKGHVEDLRGKSIRKGLQDGPGHLHSKLIWTIYFQCFPSLSGGSEHHGNGDTGSTVTPALSKVPGPQQMVSTHVLST